MSAPEALNLFRGGGEMGKRIRAMDWSGTAVGPIDAWPQSLKTIVSVCVQSQHPIVIWWGDGAFTQFYNDAYIPILGNAKHPWLGRSGRECWAEIWPEMGPRLDEVFRTGRASWFENLLYVIQRHLPREEGYFTFSYSPIYGDDGEASGIFCACNETTAQVIGDRRLKTLRDLGGMAAEITTVDKTCEIAVRVLGENPYDVPFALIYLLNEDETRARLICASGLETGASAAPSEIDLRGPAQLESTWPIGRALDKTEPEVLRGLAEKFGRLPAGPWPESADAALILPIAAPGHTHPTGFLISGLSPRRVIDQDYISFLSLAAGHVGAAIANARAYDEERRRAEALAAIDRAKTTFFSNVSHEFRTPLSLMMGPLEQVLAKPADEVLPDNRALLELAHRNSLRLLKLVNSLLDFSRIEAGRAQASYQPTDLAGLTADLASNFRSACERAGLSLVIDCRPLAEPAFVDREMWEKIVLNLLSNAFKFTFEGEIAVRLREEGGHAELSVSDSGAGIAPHDMPRLFERFHRIEGQRSRSHEGSGIGLALVQELVRLHKGTIKVDSAIGRGTAFTVIIPLGRSHLPPDRVEAESTLASTAVRAEAYVGEALRWLPHDAASLAGGDPAFAQLSPKAEAAAADRGRRGGVSDPALQTPVSEGRAERILVADDNADMRAYIGRLLGQHFDVQSVSDGQAAIEAIRDRAPDLVLADVMMPRLDGLGLLRALRSDPALSDIPVIMLSARAGEENRVEGMYAGADDYLVKPFSARELIARIRSKLELVRLRRSYEQQLAADLDAMTRLQRVGSRSVRAGNAFLQCLEEVLDAAIAITGAERGSIQLLESESGALKIAAQRGFDSPFLRFFSDVDGHAAAACGAALQAGVRIVVEDVAESDIFRNTPALGVMLQAGARAVQSTPLVSSTGNVLGMLSTHFAAPHRPSERDLRFVDILAQHAADYLERKQAEAAQRRGEAWLAGQKEAFQAAVNGAPLEDSLHILVRTAARQVDGRGRCAFYIANADRTGLRHVAGMPESYAECVCDFKIGPDSLACGLAAYTGEPVITRDVATDPLWKDWRWLAEKYNYRAIWSFPVETTAGKVVGTFALYFEQPREPAARDTELAAALTQTAGIIISRHEEAEARARTVAQLEKRAAQLKLLTDELNHRVKNTLANVQAIAVQTMRSTLQPDEFAKRFSGRLQSLARVHSLLTQSTWEGADLRELIHDQLFHGAVDGSRLTAWGPTVHLEPQTAVHVAMILHELGTNCIKYGALSAEKGRVTVNWAVTGEMLNLQWVERGGPPASAPLRHGFGTRLIEGNAQSEGGKAEQLIEPEGMTWRISLRLPPETRQEIDQKPAIVTPTPSAQTQSPGADESDAPLAGLRFLVVEDESLIAMDFVDTLKRYGADEATPASAEWRCLELLETSAFDFALLDANLQGRCVDGIVAALTRRKIPFIFVTGYGRAGLPAAFQHAPVLAKPVSEDQLLEAVAATAAKPKKVVRLKP